MSSVHGQANFICVFTLASPKATKVVNMVEVTFVPSLDDRQPERLFKVSKGLMEKRPDVKVIVLDSMENKTVLDKFHLKYGPCVLIDGKLAYVGIPRLRSLLDRLDVLASGTSITPGTTVKGFK